MRCYLLAVLLVLGILLSACNFGFGAPPTRYWIEVDKPGTGRTQHYWTNDYEWEPDTGRLEVWNFWYATGSFHPETVTRGPVAHIVVWCSEGCIVSIR